MHQTEPENDPLTRDDDSLYLYVNNDIGYGLFEDIVDSYYLDSQIKDDFQCDQDCYSQYRDQTNDNHSNACTHDYHHITQSIQGANLRIFKKTRIYLKELSERSSYLQNFWYSLKYCTGILHGIYILYYKLLLIYSDSKIKSPYHNLVHRPHTIQFNARLLPHLIAIVLAQIRDIYHMVSRKYYLKLQDETSMVGVCANKSLENFLDFDYRFFGEHHFGKLVKLEWL